MKRRKRHQIQAGSGEQKKAKSVAEWKQIADENPDGMVAKFFSMSSEANTEELTGELIVQLAAEGVPETNLRWLASQGWRYNRARNSFVDPNIEAF